MAIIVKDLVYKYTGDTTNALDGISFTIEEGEWVSIIGHNGSGKSTLSKILMGILEYKKGTIEIDSLILNEENSYEIRKGMGMISQNPDDQFVASSIEDDIAFGLENLLIPQEEMQGKIDDALERVSMTEFKDKAPSDLSGGQKQRAAIAGILAMNPKYIIFDEASSMLDPKGRDDLLNIMESLHSEGKTIIMITHNMNEVLHSDRTIVLNNGKIVKDDKTLEVMNDRSALDQSNLEMPSDLYLYHELKKNNYSNEEVLKVLWELASRK